MSEEQEAQQRERDTSGLKKHAKLLADGFFKLAGALGNGLERSADTVTPRFARALGDAFEDTAKSVRELADGIDRRTLIEQRDFLGYYRRFLTAQVTRIDNRLASLERKEEETKLLSPA
jgi:hypothetical protein